MIRHLGVPFYSGVKWDEMSDERGKTLVALYVPAVNCALQFFRTTVTLKRTDIRKKSTK